MTDSLSVAISKDAGGRLTWKTNPVQYEDVTWTHRGDDGASWQKESQEHIDSKEEGVQRAALWQRAPRGDFIHFRNRNRYFVRSARGMGRAEITS
jgi:hypothetical protein